MTTTARRWTSRLTGALMLLVVVAIATLFLLPKALGYDLYVVTTGSMSGTVDPGGLVIADRVPVGELAVGNVITYAPPASSRIPHLVTHRIVDVGRDGEGVVVYRTKGDANASVDPWTFRLDSPVQPRLQWSVPAVGWPVLWMNDRETRMLALGLPALLIALLALKDVVAGLRPVRTPAEPVASPRVIDLTAPAPAPAAAPAPAPAARAGALSA